MVSGAVSGGGSPSPVKAHRTLALPNSALPPCRQMGRLVHVCTSLTLPISPARTSSTPRRIGSPEWAWLPICVATFCCLAVSAMSRASEIEWVNGFWV